MTTVFAAHGPLLTSGPMVRGPTWWPNLSLTAQTEGGGFLE
jgi:hypothetical protein